MIILLTILVIGVITILVLLAFMLTSSSADRKEISTQSASITLLQQQLEAIRASQTTFGETVQKNLQAGRQSVDKHLLASKETLEKLQNQLGTLKGDSERMLQLGVDVRNLQDILKDPKLRGLLGEQSLEKLLREILPADSFTLQHQFKNGKTVDALARMPDYSVPIDAKFPLQNFEAMIKAGTDEEKEKKRRVFQKDVVNRIDEIASKYINPEEGTLDFALMYIPAENVYYETIVKYESDRTDILRYSLDRKVIPVSPNLLYAYLMTIVMGLHGLQIEKQAAQIRQNLGKLAGSFTSFTENWEILGKHLRNAQGQYDEGQTKLNRFTLELDQIQGGNEDKITTDNI
ncbi:MAG: DNA recombination protein RmuC [Planctomycetota bacterium]|jgi:DNA recombination protein RmuC